MASDDLPRVTRYGTYHNHTTWSDGRYSPEELVSRATKLGFAEIGVTDHYFTQKGGIRCVHDDQIAEYASSVRSLSGCREHQGDDASKGSDPSDPRVLVGLEIDTSTMNPQRWALPVEVMNTLDYVLFEYVGLVALSGFTLDELLAARSPFTCEVGLAHPDLPSLVEQYGAARLVEGLVRADIFIDVCGSRRNSRPGRVEREGVARDHILNIEGLGPEFEDVALDLGLKCVPSSDTHRDGPRDDLESTDHAIEAIAHLGLERKVFPDGSAAARGS